MAAQRSCLSHSARSHCLTLPPITESAWEWQLQGKCRELPPEMFFPDDHVTSTRHRQESAAKRVCQQCPVLEQCRDHALRTPEPHGIWGAMTAQERSRVLMGHRAPAV